jgi:hypothetical protein
MGKYVTELLSTNDPKNISHLLTRIYDTLAEARRRDIKLNLDEAPANLSYYYQNSPLDTPLAFDYMDKLSKLKPASKLEAIAQMLDIVGTYPGLEQAKLIKVKIKKRMGLPIDPDEIDDNMILDLL